MQVAVHENMNGMAVRRYAGMPLPFNENICTFACTGGLFLVSLHVDRMGISRHLRMSKEFDWNFQRFPGE